MEEEFPPEILYIPDTQDSPESPAIIVQLEYFLNDYEKKEGNLKFGSYEDKIEKISYEDITYSFYLFLKYYSNIEDEEEESGIISNKYADIKLNNIKYEFIRYFDGDGWLLLEEKEIIFLDDELASYNLKIMIKATIISDINKKYEMIDKEINYIYNEMLKENTDYSPPDAPLNLVVLTANPLMDDKKELRTMNDFNIITSKIYNSFSEEDYLKYTEFCPLTKSILKDIITNEEKRPVILHLICKSTYKILDNNKIKENNNDDSYIRLIFEKDYKSNSKINNYNLEFIDKETLKNEIFNFDDNPKIKENIEKITLIISTQLAEDVYDIFKDFGFKNIIIQHTTLSDVNFVAEFNYSFYKNLITHLAQPINIIYEEALNISTDKKNPPTFCCCFHKHNSNCNFKKNIINEFYNKNNRESDLKELEKIEQLLPHFYHLLPECPFSEKCVDKINLYNKDKIKPEEKYPENSFSFHHKDCYEYFNYNKKGKNIKIKYNKKSITFYNICCCKVEPKYHNINYIFKKDFTNEENNNEIRFRKAEIMKENRNIPNYEKMGLLVGKNHFVLEVLKFFFSENINLKKF